MKNEIITIGVITDTHYSNIETAWSRYYRDSILKIREAIKAFNVMMPSFFIHLGDSVDNGKTPEIELGYLKAVEAEYEKFNGIRHYVIGNHDVASFSKEQFNSIPYFTFRAVVEGHGLENNAYSLIHVCEDGSVNVEGFGKQKTDRSNPFCT